jgi:hypothetical protein
MTVLARASSNLPDQLSERPSLIRWEDTIKTDLKKQNMRLWNEISYSDSVQFLDFVNTVVIVIVAVYLTVLVGRARSTHGRKEKCV